LQRDDKSFLYLAITSEDFPKPVFMRGLDLERLGIDPFSPHLSLKAGRKFKVIYGPYTSGHSLKLALDLIRKSIPWSTCEPPSVTGKTNSCFYRHLGQCPGVCTGEISKREYGRIIRQLMLFFEGKKERVVRQMKREMQMAAKHLEFERAADLKRKIFALTHIQDVALVKHDEPLPYVRLSREYVDIMGRIEGYDISNISGTSAVGSMVVFENGKPNKSEYRKFKIKTVIGANDFAMMEEVLRRRLVRAARQEKSWPLPELMVIDGGKGQVGRVQQVLDELGLKVPIVGLAKGYDRKQDVLVLDESNKELKRAATTNKEVLQRVRDESHRFAVSYHRKLRGKRSLFDPRA
ncbi:MAG: UvrB/UvrC motif-containing protein, partial [Patescibacteria group bacterium]